VSQQAHERRQNPARFRPVKGLNGPAELFWLRRRHLRQASKRNGSIQLRSGFPYLQFIGVAISCASSTSAVSPSHSSTGFWADDGLHGECCRTTVVAHSFVRNAEDPLGTPRGTSNNVIDIATGPSYSRCMFTLPTASPWVKTCRSKIMQCRKHRAISP